MPTASQELIALAESAMGAGCWGAGGTVGRGCALSGAYNHICTPSQCCDALTQKSVSRVVCACVRACVRGRLLLLMLRHHSSEEQPSSAKRHEAAAGTARLLRHLPGAENFLEKTADEAEITSTSVNSRLSLLSATVSNVESACTLFQVQS